MAFPEYIPTRAVSVGGSMAQESSDPLILKVAVTSTKRSLVWNATGYRYESVTVVKESAPGGEVVFLLPCTDTAGWRDPEINAIIDVSEPGTFTHQYNAEVEVFVNGRVVRRFKLGPFTVPAGEGTIDLDNTVPASTVAGGVVMIPDVWSQIVNEASGVASDAQSTLDDLAAQRGLPGGFAELDADGVVPEGQLPFQASSFATAAQGEKADEAVPNTPAGRTALAGSTELSTAIAGMARTMHILCTHGQSNALGTNTAGTGDPTKYDVANVDVPDARIFMFQGSGPQASQIVQAVDPMRGPVNAQGMGPAMPFAREYLATIPLGDVVLIVQAAVGATGYAAAVTAHRWQVADVPGMTNLHTNMKTMLAAAMVAGAAAGYRPKVVAFLSQMGEADADGGVTGAAYAAFEDAAIADVRAVYPDALWIEGRVAPARRDATATGPDIDAAHVNLPARVIRTATVAPLTHLAADNTHADATGQRLNGHSMFLALERARNNVKGVLPKPPVSVSATTVGTVTTVVWEVQPGRVTDFLIEYADYVTGEWTVLTHAASIKQTATLTAANAPTGWRISTINEAGVSAPTVSGSAGGALPAPQGLTVVSPSATSIYAAWAAVEGATGYTYQYRTDAASSWTSVEVTDPHASVTGLTSGTVYRHRVIAKTGSTPGTPSSYVRVKAANAGLGSLVSARARALRKLVSGYTGAAIRVRLSTDNSETDIPFSGNDLDLAFMLGLVASGGSLYVVTFYDQSGNGRHVTQSDPAKQPLLVNAGLVNTLGGRPMPKWDGVDDYLTYESWAGLYAAVGATVCGVVAADPQTDSNSHAIVSEMWNGGNNTMYMVQQYKTALTQLLRNNTNVTMAAQAAGTETPSLATSDVEQFSFVDSGTLIKKWVNSAALADLAYTRSGTVNLTRTSEGALVRGATPTVNSFFKGAIPELACFVTALSDTDRGTVETAQKDYYLTA